MPRKGAVETDGLEGGGEESEDKEASFGGVRGHGGWGEPVSKCLDTLG